MRDQLYFLQSILPFVWPDGSHALINMLTRQMSSFLLDSQP